MHAAHTRLQEPSSTWQPSFSSWPAWQAREDILRSSCASWEPFFGGQLRAISAGVLVLGSEPGDRVLALRQVMLHSAVCLVLAYA